MSSCPGSKPFPTPLNIPQPSQNCNTQQDLSIIPDSPYNGTIYNASFSIRPLSSLKPTPPEIIKGLSDINIPETFSWGENGGNMIEDGSRNQKACGSCWAFAIASVIGDRYALKYNIAAPKPSVTNLISCIGPKVPGVVTNTQPFSTSCRCGNDPHQIPKYITQNNAIRSEACMPYSMVSENNSDIQYRLMVAPNCPNWDNDCCINCCGDNQESKKRFYVLPNTTEPVYVCKPSLLGQCNSIDLQKTIIAIKQEVMYAPVVTTILVPQNFMSWWTNQQNNNNSNRRLLSEDIFIPTKPFVGGHAICITGWGNKNGIDYWEIRNSWGYPGYCYFAMSTSTNKENWCGIDIPIIENDTVSGGVVKFEVGDLIPSKDNYNWEKGTGMKSIGEGWKGKPYKFNYWIIVILIIIVVIIVSIIII